MTRMPRAADRGWWASAPGAEGVFAGQLLIGLALTVVWSEPDNGFELTTRGNGLLTLLVTGAVVIPALLLVIGIVHAFVFTRPALALARRTGEVAAAPVWLLGMSAACALLLHLAGFPFVVSLAWIAGVGVLPLLVAGLALRTTRSCGFVATVAYAVSGALALAALIGAPFLSDGASTHGYGMPGLLRQPGYAGTWRGVGGGTVLLRDGGELAVEDIPVGRPDGSAERCTASGTWRERPADPVLDRRAGVDMTVSGCPGWEPQWQEDRSGARPELHPVGNPGAGSMRPLWRSGPPDVLVSP
ncbi:hypothetical protein ACGFSI_23660 [Streptomyces virginiae]|uniref:hypothetical protein n=1 Tax=Streptomyces virginiae TaxID=1961 RepID=UPI00371714FE